jgi:hypothetical protein
VHLVGFYYKNFRDVLSYLRFNLDWTISKVTLQEDFHSFLRAYECLCASAVPATFVTDAQVRKIKLTLASFIFRVPEIKL